MPTDPFAPLATVAEPCLAFTALDGQAFVRLPVASGGFFSLPVRSAAFRHWFYSEFYGRYATVPAPRQFSALLHYLEARANHYDERCCRLPVFRRVAASGPSRIPQGILLDLANSDRQFVEISPSGWKTTVGPDVLFRTSRSTRALPIPDPRAAASVASLTTPIPNPQPLN